MPENRSEALRAEHERLRKLFSAEEQKELARCVEQLQVAQTWLKENILDRQRKLKQAKSESAAERLVVRRQHEGMDTKNLLAFLENISRIAEQISETETGTKEKWQQMKFRIDPIRPALLQKIENAPEILNTIFRLQQAPYGTEYQSNSPLELYLAIGQAIRTLSNILLKLESF